MLKLFATQEEKEMLIEALGNYGKPLLEEKKPSRETKKKIASIEKLIHQIHGSNLKIQNFLEKKIIIFIKQDKV